MTGDRSNTKQPESTFALELDHIAVAAPSLAVGRRFVENSLGVKLSLGGKHVFMGTHNLLLRLGNRLYLEVIAIDPQADAPPAPRWFNLDDPLLQAELQVRPRLVHWIVRTQNIQHAAGLMPEISGPARNATRGDLSWTITIPSDGSLPLGGAYPTFIKWPPGPHVATRMPDAGCDLVNLVISHPDAESIRGRLSPYFHDTRVGFRTSADLLLEARIMTPNGERILR